ncbi:MAG: hypothetical protein ACRCWQ_10975 [Bacilli bacterium]
MTLKEKFEIHWHNFHALREYTELHDDFSEMNGEEFESMTGKTFDSAYLRECYILDLVGKILQSEQGYCIRHGKIVECDGIGIVDEDVFYQLSRMHIDLHNLIDQASIYDKMHLIHDEIKNRRYELEHYNVE